MSSDKQQTANRRGKAIRRTEKLEALKQKHSKLASKLNALEIEIKKIETLIELENF